MSAHCHRCRLDPDECECGPDQPAMNQLFDAHPRPVLLERPEGLTVDDIVASNRRPSNIWKALFITDP